VLSQLVHPQLIAVHLTARNIRATKFKYIICNAVGEEGYLIANVLVGQ